MDAKHAELTQASAAQNDQVFLNLLSHIRRGKVTDEINRLLQSRVGVKFPSINGVDPIWVFPCKKEVEECNTRQLKKIKSPAVSYWAYDIGDDDYLCKPGDPSSGPIRWSPTVDELKLKNGARVMLTVNLDVRRGLCNGLQGTIKSTTGRSVVDTKEEEKIESGPINMYHDNDDDNRFDLMQRTRVHPLIGTDMSKALLYIHKKKTWPDVVFDNGVKIMIQPFVFDHVIGKEVVASRVQLPLMLSYALTINKVQGMTLPPFYLSTEKIFADGQFYVGISRARRLEDISLDMYNPAKCVRHPKVVDAFLQLGVTQKKKSMQKLLSSTPSYMISTSASSASSESSSSSSSSASSSASSSVFSDSPSASSSS